MSSKKGFTSVDEYIAACPVETHEGLQAIRAEVKKIAPEAKEKISYQIAAFELNGKNLLAFAGWKKHVSIYPIPAGDEAFNEEISKYADGKGTVKFPLGKPMPIKLVHQIVKNRVSALMQNKKRRPVVKK